MRIHKIAANALGYSLDYDKTLKTYKLVKHGYNVLYVPKAELDTMPVYKLVTMLKTNDQII